jgi:hypothetical protein
MEVPFVPDTFEGLDGSCGGRGGLLNFERGKSRFIYKFALLR